MAYEPLYHDLQKWQAYARFFWPFLFSLWSSFLYFGGVFNKTIISLALVGELPKKHFQTKLHSFLLDILKKHDDYIDISQITSALKTYNIELEFFIQTYLVRVTELVIYVNDLTQSV